MALFVLCISDWKFPDFFQSDDIKFASLNLISKPVILNKRIVVIHDALFPKIFAIIKSLNMNELSKKIHIPIFKHFWFIVMNTS